MPYLILVSLLLFQHSIVINLQHIFIIMFQKEVLSKQTKAVLFNFKKQLKQKNIGLKQLVTRLFQFQKQKFRPAEFGALIKQIDYRLSYPQIDRIWSQLDSNANGFVFLNDLIAHLNNITDDDDPFRNKLDQQSQLIKSRIQIQNGQNQHMQQNQKIVPQKAPQISQNDQIVLALKQFKDLLKDTDPWQLFDVFDEDRDGKLNVEEMKFVFDNFGVSNGKAALLVKGIFQGKHKCSFEDILKALSLENIGKRVDFEEIENPKSFIKEPNLLNSVRMSRLKTQQKQMKKQQKPKQQIVIQNIPSILEPYFNYSSEMTEPLLSTAMSQLMANQVFLDVDNPHAALAHRWEHITKIFRGGYYLFENRESRLERSKERTGLGLMMDANNIIQGGVGDCYLMSAIAGIVEHYPELIYRLFVLDKNPVSIYGVRLFVDGVWETVITDARFPVNFHGRFVYAKPHRHQIWVMILEKAWAKLYKSFQNINAGYSDEGLTAITGAPCINMNSNQQGTLQKTQIYLKKGYIINCSGSSLLGQMTPSEQQDMGIFDSHAYSVIGIHPNLSWKSRNVTLVKVRNPWGRKAWKGDWSFSSGTWTNELRNKLNYNKDPSDGTFYMNIEDFMTYFDKVTACFVSLGKVNSHIELTSNRTNSVMVAFTVKIPGEYFFSLYQQNRRKYKASTNYELSKSRMFLGRVVKGTIEAVSSKACLRSNLHLQSTLVPGDYIISCKIKWNYKERNSFNLTSYGQQHITFREIPKDKNFIHQFVCSRAEFQLGKKIYYQKHPLTTSYKIIYADPKQGYGYVLVRNNTHHMMETTIRFNKAKGLKLIKPDGFPLNLFVPPNSSVVRPLLVDPEGYQYDVMENFGLH